MSVLPASGFALLALDPKYGGSCPCADLVLAEGTYELHCWRVCSQCEGCGIHYEGSFVIARRMKRLLDAMNWYGRWSIQKGLRR